MRDTSCARAWNAESYLFSRCTFRGSPAHTPARRSVSKIPEAALRLRQAVLSRESVGRAALLRALSPFQDRVPRNRVEIELEGPNWDNEPARRRAS